MKDSSSVILVIDDSASVLKFIALTLQEQGYTVLVASDGIQGLAIAESRHPDLILLDVMMPGIDGFEVCGKLKSMNGMADTPVIFLTARVESIDIIKGFESGAVDYVTKPFKQEELLVRVRTHLELAASRKLIKFQEERLNFALEGSDIGVWDWNTNTPSVEFSNTFVNLTGLTRAEIGDSYEGIINFMDSRHRAAFASLMRDINTGAADKFNFEFIIQSKSGDAKWIMSKGKVVEKSGNRPVRIIGTHTDITKIKETEETIRILSMAIQQSANLIVLTDTEGKIEFVNNTFCAVTGFSEGEALGANPRILKSGLMDNGVYETLWQTIKSGKVWRGELHNRNKSGDLFWVSASINPIVNSSGEIIRFLSVQEDITEKKKLEKELHYHATTDMMTGAYNRHTGIELLKKQVQLYRRLLKPLVVAFIDLNDLKYVNDHFGHSDGDDYIKTVVEQINNTIRESDTVCRMGGDEFLIIMPDCDLPCSESIMKRIASLVEKINSGGGYRYPLSISYGVAQYDPDQDRDLSALIERADNEMYIFKKKYKDEKKRGGK